MGNSRIFAMTAATSFVPAASTAPTLVCDYNDLEGAKRVFEANRGQIAGVILEPVVGNSGFIEPDRSFATLLDHMLTDPARHVCELELIAVCMALGFEGRYRVLDNGRAQLDSVRERLAQMLRPQAGAADKADLAALFRR